MPWKDKMLDVGAVVISLVALGVSAWAGLVADRAHRDTQEDEAVARAYAAFEEMNKLQIEHPEVAHVLTNVADYRETAQLVRAAAGDLTPERQAEHLLAESAMAFYIFSEVNRLVTARANAERLGQTERVRFLDATLRFYTETLLRNPRLAYYWHDRNAGAYYPRETREFFGTRVWAAGAGKPVIDAGGPFVRNDGTAAAAPPPVR